MSSIDDLIPCKWCSQPTNMHGTKECDRCWELRHRIENNPKMAERMIKVLVVNERSNLATKIVNKILPFRTSIQLIIIYGVATIFVTALFTYSYG